MVQSLNRYFLVWLTVVFILSFSSCISNKKIIYLQDEDQSIPEDSLVSYDLAEYRLQYNDIIDVKALTAEDMIREGFNFREDPGQNNRMGMGQGGGDIYYMTGYTVDKEGYIRIPLAGRIFVRDMTLEEARLSIEEALRKYVTTELYVRVKLGGIRYTAFGEFRKPGKYVILQDRMTIFEAIANAGDMTVVAKRDEVLLIRQYPDGTKLHTIDLTDRSIIQSPYYFIQPNDQLYAEPMKVRELGAGENTAQSLALIISSITAVALVLNLIN
ncbi:polysaccharide biosynthesis/export family protein [Echinicola sp. CAU 1574]|uniref:Polysaccharide biosynthesis/export family protein n=1 Tax=Echinicola arenosa TaxID=2774144 RepID=A0ABR9AMN2_9BACT|nr:polysaccharide biosynthesis/export family protein [Echinicola arenosa]MBD8490062.1 polysaccharide biosynthesis/export family protein [Echinicola arenosa]